MKNVLLLVHDDAGQEARLQAALDVVRAIEGHLTCVDVAVYPEIPDDGYGATAMLLLDEREREAANRSALERRLAVEGLPWNWIDTTGSLAGSLEAHAGLADLIVVNCRLETFASPDMRSVAGDVLVKARKPLLAVPEATRGIRLGGHAMIAWDGSGEASQALQAAVPLLRFADKVTIAEIEDGSVSTRGEAAAIYLSRHGIGATVHSLKAPNPGAADSLPKLVKLMNADYLVLGAFGHGRLREAVFGGVTRRMLTESHVPLFLAH